MGASESESEGEMRCETDCRRCPACTIQSLRETQKQLVEALKAAMGHCDCADYNGKALVPCTEANPCGGCYTVIVGQAALARAEEEK